jgi:hypothetical protein
MTSPLPARRKRSERVPVCAGWRPAWGAVFAFAVAPAVAATGHGSAARDAADALFSPRVVPGLTDIADGANGFAVVDLDGDDRLDIVSTWTLPGRGLSATGHRLRVHLGTGGFGFRSHALALRGTPLQMEEFGRLPEIPNLADFNGDGWLDLLVTRSAPEIAGERLPGVTAIGNTLLVSAGSWDVFEDRSEALGIRNERGYNRQSSFADVDADGWLDIAIGCDNIGNAIGGLPISRLYVFRPASGGAAGESFERGTFVDLGERGAIPDFGGFHHDAARDRATPGIALRDLDGDGDFDLVQSAHVDVRQPLLPYSPGEYRQGMFVWRNLLAERGALQFEKVAGNGLAVEARLRYDRATRRYQPVGVAPGLPYVSFADVDGDGLQDVLAVGSTDAGWAPRAEDVGGRFWRNAGALRFAEATAAAGLEALNWNYRQWYAFLGVAIPPALERQPRARTYPTHPGQPVRHPLDDRFYFADSVFGDFDNDADLDLVVLDRHVGPTRPAYRAILFVNRGDGTFAPASSEASGLFTSGISAEAADLDDDGLLDLLIAGDPDNSGGRSAGAGADAYGLRLLANTGAAGARARHWIALSFRGLTHARLIGARIEASAGGRRQYRWLHTNHGYKSGGALTAHFGLDTAKRADVSVRLPDGTTWQVAGLEADRRHVLEPPAPP